MTLKSLDPRLRGDDESGATSNAAFARHSRERGNPGLHPGMAPKFLDPRLRGDDESGSFPRTRESRAPSRHGSKVPGSPSTRG
ncbi:hypothetical protein DX914_06905 [Lysobacter silvisoli]|uniref:Uncharacterized protein n=1 Tax=Lysobacter silvisoli TaxID=2293254 RepID=A0A371K4Q4_9GAMM|nr:hypothetical protein DX914_06905 [Lysobacter silvisoli]